MHITVFGSGYVGLVTGACLAEVGNQVLCVDVDQGKIDKLKQGIMPIFEPGLDTMIERNYGLGRIDFTTDMDRAVAFGEIQFIAVGTPPDEDGSADLKYVLQVARTIGERMTERRIVVDKSTVPVGTADKVRNAVAEELAKRGVAMEFHVVSNPEFLKEGAAITDFMKPDRIVLGSDSEYAAKRMHELYSPFSRNHEKTIHMDIRSAELTKYAANAMLATKISFMNEMASLAERLDADIESVRRGIGSDPRIGFHFIYPGCGYGGSCFPKDVKALIATSDTLGFNAEILKSVESVNDRQKSILYDKMRNFYGDAIAGRTFAIWGLSFKPNTDDMREAPSRVLMEALWSAGAKVRAYDPVAREEAERIYGERSDLTLVESAAEALEGADALAINTEWTEFKSPDFDLIKSRLSQPVVFDGRNLYDPILMGEHGIHYFSIGRRPSLAD